MLVAGSDRKWKVKMEEDEGRMFFFPLQLFPLISLYLDEHPAGYGKNRDKGYPLPFRSLRFFLAGRELAAKLLSQLRHYFIHYDT